MQHQSSRRLEIGFRVLEEIPPPLRRLVDDVVACYQRHHRANLRSIFVIGSVAVGEWTEGVSDLDIVGVLDREPTVEEDSARRRELIELGYGWRQVSFINNSVLSLRALHAATPDLMALGRARIIAVSGLHLWGEKLDFTGYIPTVELMAFERTARARILIGRYRAGIINEPFRSNSRLLTRSCAKAALRVLSSMTILSGAVYYTSPQKIVMMIEQYVPEALPLATRALAILNGAGSDVGDAMGLIDETIELFYAKYPDYRPP